MNDVGFLSLILKASPVAQFVLLILFVLLMKMIITVY
jgi:hypothetical protein